MLIQVPDPGKEYLRIHISGTNKVQDRPIDMGCEEILRNSPDLDKFSVIMEAFAIFIDNEDRIG
jgi:hypothetical protein